MVRIEIELQNLACRPDDWQCLHDKRTADPQIRGIGFAIVLDSQVKPAIIHFFLSNWLAFSRKTAQKLACYRTHMHGEVILSKKELDIQ